MNRTQEEALAAGLAELYANQHARVLAIVGRNVRWEDRDLVEDLAQDVWLMFWQYLLRGNEVRRPSGLLSVFARRRVFAYYRLARVRREQVTDPQDRVISRITAALGAVA